jgi:hypothetical protein
MAGPSHLRHLRANSGEHAQSRGRQDRTGQAGFQPAGIGRFRVAGSGKGVLAAMPPGRAGGMLGV